MSEQTKTPKRTISLLLAALVVALLATAATAYALIAGLPESGNDFKVSVNEPQETSYRVMPGATQPIDSTISVDVNQTAYLFAALVDGTNGKVKYAVDEGWTPLKDDNGMQAVHTEGGVSAPVYYREVTQGSSTLTLLKEGQITFPASLSNEDLEALNSADANTIEDGDSSASASADGAVSPNAVRIWTQVTQQEGFTGPLAALNGYYGTGSFSVALPNTDKYLYRVGNKNAVELGSLFSYTDTADPATAVSGNDIEVEVKSLDDETSVAKESYTSNADWAKSTLQFTGEGPVRVTLSGIGKPCELLLEVIDGWNVTEYGDLSGHKSSNTVFLNDIVMSDGGKIEFPNASVYGNGFTFDVSKGASAGTGAISNNYLILLSDGSKLDNLNITGAVYTSYGAMASSNYNNPVVYSVGDAQITNCIISNCAAPVRVGKGNIYIYNSTLRGGSYANLDMRGGNVTLEDVTTVNQFESNDEAANGKRTVGFGIAAYYESNLEDSVLTIIGKLTQYNWLSDSDRSYFSDDFYRGVIYDAIFSQSYSNYQYNDGNHVWVNTGVVSMSDVFGHGSIIIQANAEASGVVLNSGGTNGLTGYLGQPASLGSATGYVYAPVKSIPQAPTYREMQQYDIAPIYSFEYPISQGNKNYSNVSDKSYCIYSPSERVIKIGYEYDGAYEFDPNILAVSKYGREVIHLMGKDGSNEYSVSLNGVDYTNRTITFTGNSENYTLEYRYIDPFNYDLADVENTSDGIVCHNHSYRQVVQIRTVEAAPDAKDTLFTFGAEKVASTITDITAGGETRRFALPNSKGSNFGQMTYGGKTIYYPIVEMITSDGKTSHTSSWVAYFSVFKDAVEITDHDNGSIGLDVVYGASTQEKPIGLEVMGGKATQYTGGAKEAFRYQASDSNVQDKVTTSKNVLYYCGPKNLDGGNTRKEDNLVVMYRYTDNAGREYYYFIGYHCAEQTKGSDGGCITAGTPITLADGTSKPVEEIVKGDLLQTFSFASGEVSQQPVVALERGSSQDADIITLQLSDGSTLEVVNEQSFFDMETREYFTVKANNCQDYAGRAIMKLTEGDVSSVRIEGAEVRHGAIEYYEIITATDYNFVANGMLTCEPFIFNSNIFSIGEDYRFDRQAMLQDIKAYGLFSYSEFGDYLSEDEFLAFGGPFFKIAVGKGVVSYEQIFDAFEIYRRSYEN